MAILKYEGEVARQAHRRVYLPITRNLGGTAPIFYCLAYQRGDVLITAACKDFFCHDLVSFKIFRSNHSCTSNRKGT